MHSRSMLSFLIKTQTNRCLTLDYNSTRNSVDRVSVIKIRVTDLPSLNDWMNWIEPFGALLLWLKVTSSTSSSMINRLNKTMLDAVSQLHHANRISFMCHLLNVAHDPLHLLCIYRAMCVEQLEFSLIFTSIHAILSIKSMSQYYSSAIRVIDDVKQQVHDYL